MPDGVTIIRFWFGATSSDGATANADAGVGGEWFEMDAATYDGLTEAAARDTLLHETCRFYRTFYDQDAEDAVEVHLKSLMDAGDPIPIGVLQEPEYEVSLGSLFERAFRRFSSKRHSCSSRIERVRLEPAAARARIQQTFGIS